MLDCGVYKIINLVNNKCYVGQSIKLKERESQHWNGFKNGDEKRENRHLLRAVKKYGIEKFSFSILIYCEPEELTYYEENYKKYLHAEYNIRICVDSNKGIKFSEETKQKMSNSSMGKPGTRKGAIASEETKKKMSEAQSGKNAPWYGKKGDKNPSSKPVLQFTKDGLFIARFASIKEAENETGILASCIGRTCSGKTKTSGGYLWSYENSKNLPIYIKPTHNSKPVVQYSKDGIEINRFESAVEAQRKTGIGNANISSVCLGIRKTTGGYIWKFADDLRDVSYNISKTSKRPVIQFSKDGMEIQRFESMTEAKRKTGVDNGDIGKCCRGIFNIAGGYIWKYADS